jgi:hypothetical protein
VTTTLAATTTLPPVTTTMAATTTLPPVTTTLPAGCVLQSDCLAAETCVGGTCIADADHDGIADGDDPCPADARNLCFGSVAVDGTTGNDIRLNAIVSGTASCAGARTDCNGDVWNADFAFNQAAEQFECNLADCSISGIDAIFGCTDASTEEMFQCEHWDDTPAPELIYDFDVPDGSYVVNLYFAEVFADADSAGARAFDISIEGVTVYAGFDQFAAGNGQGMASVRSAVVTVADGNGLQIELGHLVENPAIKAIEVLAQ